MKPPGLNWLSFRTGLLMSSGDSLRRSAAHHHLHLIGQALARSSLAHCFARSTCSRFVGRIFFLWLKCNWWEYFSVGFCNSNTIGSLTIEAWSFFRLKVPFHHSFSGYIFQMACKSHARSWLRDLGAFSPTWANSSLNSPQWVIQRAVAGMWSKNLLPSK